VSAGRHRAPRGARKPVKKVTAATAAAAAVALTFTILGALGVDVPAHVQIEVTTLAVFAAGYLKRP